MRKLLSVVMIGMVSISLIACGQSEKKETAATTATQVESITSPQSLETSSQGSANQSESQGEKNSISTEAASQNDTSAENAAPQAVETTEQQQENPTGYGLYRTLVEDYISKESAQNELNPALFDSNSGYALADIDGNGTDELLLGQDNMIYEMYTLSGNQIQKVISGGERDRYYLCENGMIENEGSNGAANSINGYYSYSGTSLSLKEAVVYDSEVDSENPWFYCTSGYDSQQGENISEERAEEIKGSYSRKGISYTNFSAYQAGDFNR